MPRVPWFGRPYASLAVGAFVVLVTHAVAIGDGSPLGPPDYLWLTAPALLLLLRGRFPVIVFVLVAALVWTYYAADRPGGPAVLYVIMAALALVLRRGPLVAGTTAGTVMVAGTAGEFAVRGGWPDARVGLVAAWTGMVIAAITAISARRLAMAARAEREAERGRRQAEEERLRIAREVHDVVAHSLAMINVQAGVGAHVADQRPEEAKAALLAIKDASHTALEDLRATLAVLRSGEGRSPAPSLRRLGELTEPTAAAGLPVRVEGEPGELPAPVDSAAYRIVQESLTNAVRHAAGASGVTVRFRRTPAGLAVLVRDDGRGEAGMGAGDGTGNGLRGMRERAEALGGTLDAHRSAGGFEVRAQLPVPEPQHDQPSMVGPA